jgi:hypothetical protein
MAALVPVSRTPIEMLHESAASAIAGIPATAIANTR